MKLSAVVPCYNEEESLPLFFDAITRVFGELRAQPGREAWELELVLVDDGSSDGTLAVMKGLAARAPEAVDVRWVSFSRNFGKEAGLYAGLQHATGGLVATMDADMQDPPSLLPQMIETMEREGADSVGARRVSRTGEPPIRSFLARMFYKLINRISTADIADGARDFRLMRRPVVDAVLSMGEYNRFSKGIYGWVGFKNAWIPYENVERAAGESKWSVFKLFLYAFDGIAAFSTAPLAIASVAGILLCLVAFAAIIFIVVRALLFGDPVSGWPSLACIITFIGGVQLLCLGIIGQYLAKTYLETKKRPIYLVRESNIEDAAA